MILPRMPHLCDGLHVFIACLCCSFLFVHGTLRGRPDDASSLALYCAATLAGTSFNSPVSPAYRPAYCPYGLVQQQNVRAQIGVCLSAVLGCRSEAVGCNTTDWVGCVPVLAA